MEEGGEGDGGDQPSEAPPTSSEEVEFIPLSAVDLDGVGSRGRSLYASESRDPWAWISELPSSLAEKLRELRAEK